MEWRRGVIARRYLRTWFLPDVVSAFPFEWLWGGDAYGAVQLFKVRSRIPAMPALTRISARFTGARARAQPLRLCSGTPSAQSRCNAHAAHLPGHQTLRVFKMLRMLRLVKLVKMSRSSMLLHVSTQLAYAASRLPWQRACPSGAARAHASAAADGCPLLW